MHLFSRKEAPMGDLPEMIIARSPGVSTMSCIAFTMPLVGTSVPCGTTMALPVASLESVHPERSTGTPALCATLIVMYSSAGFVEPAPETEWLMDTIPR